MERLTNKKGRDVDLSMVLDFIADESFDAFYADDGDLPEILTLHRAQQLDTDHNRSEY